ncbi:MAG: hypothetical protein CL596_05225 [Alteromonas sp.]|nr:hypothetical protein [Alteromonas sp.]|tara:strand:+ start:340 stop:579 length:240 start_codon:yes stop_codon:yes gene_type:complete
METLYKVTLILRQLQFRSIFLKDLDDEFEDLNENLLDFDMSVSDRVKHLDNFHDKYYRDYLVYLHSMDFNEQDIENLRS